MGRPWYRRRVVLGAITLVGLAVVAVTTAFLLYPRFAKAAIRDKFTSKLQSRLGRDVSVGDIEVTRSGRATLFDIVVSGPADRPDPPLVRVERIVVDYDFWASWVGTVRSHRAEVEGLHIATSRDRDGRDNFGDVLRRVRTKRDGRGSRSSGLIPPVIEVTGSAAFRDDYAGASVQVASLEATMKRGQAASVILRDVVAQTKLGPEASADEMRVQSEANRIAALKSVTVDGGRLSMSGLRHASRGAEVLRKLSLTGISGTIAPGDTSGRLAIDLSGGYSDIDAELWQASGWLDHEKHAGSLAIRAKRFTFDRLEPILRGSPVVEFANTNLDADFTIDFRGTRADVVGKFSLEGLNVAHHRLAPDPVRGIELTAHNLDATLDFRSQLFQLHKGVFSSRDVDFEITGSYARPGGLLDVGDRREHQRLEFRFVVPPAHCQEVLDAIPTGLVPHLRGFALDGQFRSNIYVEADWADLDALQLKGGIGIRRCRVRRAPRTKVNANRLRGPFTVSPEVYRGRPVEVNVGPSNPDYVPLWDVSRYLTDSLMTTEDSAFYRHRGFIVPEFRVALIRNLKAGRFRYGASSITMQIVKNVMLDRQKTLSRKLQELFLTWYIETKLPKDRLLEIYVNAIEYGPRLYGIGAAARRYFDKHPRELNPVEAAFFSSILPGPKRRYKQFCRGQLWRWTERKIDRILHHMHRRGRLTDEEFEMAKQTPLVFASPVGAPFCPR